MYSKTLLVFLVVYFFSSSTHGQSDKKFFRKDYTYIEAVESFYKFHTTEKNWRDAKRECDLEGASLFYPENGDEANAVISFRRRYQNNTPSGDTWVFVGISDIITEGVYETIDGKSISEVYNNWKLNQPDNSGDEDCLHLNQKGNFNDITCDAKYSFICKKTLPSLERNCSCNNQQSNLDGQSDKKFFRKDYTYIEAVESFYKFHTTEKNWRDAKRECDLEGASLFYPENGDEANAVISFRRRYQNNTPSDDTWVFVGISDIITEGVYETIDGKSISEVYNNWKLNQPDNSGDEDCLHLNQKGNFNDITCDAKYSFICKKTLPSLERNCSCNNQQSNLDGQSDKKFFRKDYTYLEAVEGFYKFHLKVKNWGDAQLRCSLEGASLFYPENEDEAQAVISFWNETVKSDTTSVFLGLTNLINNELFETIDGKAIFEVYNNWGPGQPSEGTGCVLMDKQGYFDDIGCYFAYPFICKKSLQSVEWNYNCDMANLDYTFNESLGKCYKLHTEPLNWNDAYFACRTEQSYLAVIDTPMEAEYFMKLTESAPNRVQKKYQRGIYHLGFHNKFMDGWRKITGKRLNDASAWWGNYQPDADDEKKCGSMFYTGRLNNIDCDTKSFFICEHDVNSLNLSQNKININYTENIDQIKKL